jgi:hypothetical protein
MDEWLTFKIAEYGYFKNRQLRNGIKYFQQFRGIIE